MLRRKDKNTTLDSLVAAHKLTADGKDWLVTAMDPFHDFNHQIAGYPDADVSQTIVACYQYEKVIAKPTSAVGNWDCHIYSMPVLSCTAAAPVYNESADWATVTDPAPVATFVLGPMNINSVSTNQGFGPRIPNVVGDGNEILPAAATEDLLSGCSRIIAMGFEVHNTTSELYKQGSVTTYRMPQSDSSNSVVWKNNAATSWGVLNGKRLRAPPTDLAGANLLKGTRTWEAKDGVYATCFQSSVANPLKMAAATHTLVDPNADPGAASIVVGNVLIPVLPVVNPTSYTPAVTQTSPFDTTGAMFMGLSASTTLNLKVRIYVERAPTWSEPNLAVLASPSAAYDIQALELYGAAINFLPPAVMVNENAMGDWWRAVTSVVKKLASPMGSLLETFIPGAGAIGGAISSIAGQIEPGKSVAQQVTAQTTQRLAPAPAQQRPRNNQGPASLKKKKKVTIRGRVASRN